MHLGFIKSKKEWDNFLISNNGSFLQSTSWQNFKKDLQKTWQIEARNEDKISGVCQIFKEKTPFGSYFYIPHGPVAENIETSHLLLKQASEIAKKENIFFLRCEPLSKINIGKKAFSRIQPQKTIILNINKNDEELLQSFNSGTRRNIKIAQKKGVTIKEEDNVSIFFELLQKTKIRQKFNSYNKDYFSNLLQKTNSRLSYAYYNKTPIAGNIVFYFGKTAYCLHSATDYNYRKIKGANLLRFQSILTARDSGVVKFDNWGIDEKRFKGVTSFKKGFGGKELLYPEGVELVFKKTTYNLYKFSFLLSKKI